MKPKEFDGTTPAEAFLQQIKTCAKYYCWSDEECSIHLPYALIGDATMLVWSQLDPDGLSYHSCRRCCVSGTGQRSKGKSIKRSYA